MKYLLGNCLITDAMLDALDTTLNKKNKRLFACMGLAALWESKKLAFSCVLERTAKHLPCENMRKAIPEGDPTESGWDFGKKLANLETEVENDWCIWRAFVEDPVK